MPALHLTGRGRRIRPGEPLDDAVTAADPPEQHLGRAGPAGPPGELPAVVRLTTAQFEDSKKTRPLPVPLPTGGTRYSGSGIACR